MASEEFIAMLAETLNSSHIPCVLWGHVLLNVHGIPSITSSIDFVIPDSQLQHGMKALMTYTKDLALCPRPDACLWIADDRPTPPPAGHMHLQHHLDLIVGLYPQSDTLWFLPALDELLSCEPRILGSSSPFVLASDSTILPPERPGRGCGVFTDKNAHPVVVPRAVILLEAFMRLYARDQGKPKGSFAMAMIDYVGLYVDEDGLLDASLLPSPLKELYQKLNAGGMTLRQWTKELKAALGTE